MPFCGHPPGHAQKSPVAITKRLTFAHFLPTEVPPKGQFPRPYRITVTRHFYERSDLREITLAETEAVIREGAERPTPGRGRKGGVIVIFSKTLSPGRTVVAVGEILGDECTVITVYEKD